MMEGTVFSPGPLSRPFLNRGLERLVFGARLPISANQIPAVLTVVYDTASDRPGEIAKAKPVTGVRERMMPNSSIKLVEQGDQWEIELRNPQDFDN